MTSSNLRNAGSFRDPSGYVVEVDGRVLRVLDAKTGSYLRELETRGWLTSHMKSGNIVTTRFMAHGEAPAQLEVPADSVLLEHEKMPVVSYPYEWSFSMLADAAILHLELQESLLDMGYSLKDATAFNVLFDSVRPRFIDFGSIDRPRRFDIWYAYGQFCRMFLFPLLLKRYRNVSFPAMLMTSLDGVDVSFAYKALGWARAWSPRLFLDVGLQHLVHRPQSIDDSQSSASKPAASGDPEVQKVNLRRLKRTVERLKNGYALSGIWSTYRNTHSYNDASETGKIQFVESCLRQVGTGWVHDIGCNTGSYSRLAAKLGFRVVSSDSDHDSIECLYRELQRAPATIYPLVANIAAPTPGAGFMARERAPLLDRIEVDAVLALALVHHLMVSARLSLDMMVELFAKLTSKWLIIEYVDPSDEMFRTLLAVRDEDFSWLHLEVFRSAFSERFEELACQEVKAGKRWMLFLKKK